MCFRLWPCGGCLSLGLVVSVLWVVVALVRSWIGFDGVDHAEIFDHFIQFTNYTGGSKYRRSFLQLIWLLTVWVLWNERNARLFKQKKRSLVQLLDKVKYHSLWWLKAKKAIFAFGEHMWWSSPLSCLGIG